MAEVPSNSPLFVKSEEPLLRRVITVYSDNFLHLTDISAVRAPVSNTMLQHALFSFLHSMNATFEKALEKNTIFSWDY